MKRIIALILSIIMLLSIAACGTTPTASPSADPTKTPEPTVQPTPTPTPEPTPKPDLVLGDFTVIYPEIKLGDPVDVKLAAEAFCFGAVNNAGSMIFSMDDYLNEDEGYIEETHEILIGNTNRKETAEVIEDIQSNREIPMEGSVDKMTVQIALVVAAYFIAYVIMYILGGLLPGMKSVIFGFNFLLGVIAALIVKGVLNLLHKTSISKREYINNFLLTRISNFCFDIMIVAGVAAIRLGILQKYWGVLLIMGILGMVATYFYNYFVAKTLFKDYVEEQFLTMYGMLTGTASTGVVLLREIDGEFKTPAAENMVYQTLPAIVFGFPIMLLAALAPDKPIFVLILVLILFAVLNIILFRSKIFRRRKSKTSEEVLAEDQSL